MEKVRRNNKEIDKMQNISYDRVGGFMKKAGVIFLFFLLVTLSLSGESDSYAPNSGHLKGFIYKPDGKTPLWGAQVILQDVKNNPLRDFFSENEIVDVFSALIFSRKSIFFTL